LDFADSIGVTLRKRKVTAKRFTLVIKTSDMKSYTRTYVFENPTNSSYYILKEAMSALEQWLSEDKREVRLIGIRTIGFSQGEYSLLDFAGDKVEKIQKAESTIDTIRRKTGTIVRFGI
jgi:hypothetical protein